MGLPYVSASLKCVALVIKDCEAVVATAPYYVDGQAMLLGNMQVLHLIMWQNNLLVSLSWGTNLFENIKNL